MLARATFSDYIIGLLFAAQVCVAQTSQTKEAFEAFTIGDYRTALKLYTDVLNVNPADTASIYYQGVCYLNLGDNEHGISTLQKVLVSRAHGARAYYFIAKTEEATGAVNSALLSVKSSLKVDSAFVPAKKLFVQLLCATKQYKASLKAADSTASVDILLSLGNCLIANGRYEDAAAMAQRALVMDSTSFAAHLLLADAFSSSDSLGRACEIYSQLFLHASDYPRLLKKMAACHLKDGHHEAALSLLKVYLAATGDSTVNVLADIGRICHSISHFDSAVVYFSLAIRQDSTVAINHYNLGLAYFQLKRYRDAEHALLKAITLSRQTLELMSKQHYMLGAAYMNQNKQKSAIQAYRKAIDVNAHAFECYYFLGTVYETLRDDANAATWFRRFLQRAPKAKPFTEMRVAAQQSLKRIDAVQK